MTTIVDGPAVWEADQPEPEPIEEGGPAAGPPPAAWSTPPRPSPRRVAALVLIWAVVVVASVVLVAYGLGPVLEHRHQRTLLRDFRQEVDRAANATQSLKGYQPPKVPPAVGAPVAILDVGRLRLQQVVLEGAAPGQTEQGPGHVPGTAGPGQPGNSVIAGRRLGFGGPFHHLDTLRIGDQILVTTPEGQSVYRVATVATVKATAALYAPSKDDRLTLVTSASADPTATGRATVVTATMVGQPFTPTPQGALSSATDGRSSDPTVWPLLVLIALGFAAAIAVAAVLYARWKPLSTYLLTTPALVALAVLLAETVVRLLPAWA